jgi:hypothetical protein
MKAFYLAAAGALALATAPASAASFIGEQFKASWRLPTESALFAFTMSPSTTFTVGYGVEGHAQLSTIQFLVDFGVDSLTFTFLSNAGFSTYAFNGIYVDSLSGQGFGEIDTISGIAAARIHNMGSALSVNFSGQHYEAGDVVSVQFTPEIPEPASWTMLIAGLGMAGAALRRRAPQQRVAFS